MTPNFETVLQFRRTKIIATLGPASAKPEVLDALINAGVDVFRMNFSHGSHESHRETAKLVRDAIKRNNRHVAVLGDLCGPKIRVGRFENGPIEMRNGHQITVTTRKVPGNASLIPSEYEDLHKDVRCGDKILLADGTRELRVDSVNDTEILCTVVRGGSLSDRKGINLPGVNVSTPSFTAKDREDAELICELGLDYIAMSFVRSAKDVVELKEFLRAGQAKIPVVVKIEKPEALEDIDAILHSADAVMIARGDLGVEMPAEDVPLIQQDLIRRSVEANKPVIVATQMLESMISSGSPTRAEVTDVAWAAMAGVDAVMLSGETAVGAYPVEAVRTMDRIVRRIEDRRWKEDKFVGLVNHPSVAAASKNTDPTVQIGEAMGRTTCKIAHELNAKAIVAGALTGTTARMISAERPPAPVIALATTPKICARLSLYWGVIPYLVSDEVVRTPERFVPDIFEELNYRGIGSDGSPRYVVLVTVRNYEQHLSPSLRIFVD